MKKINILLLAGLLLGACNKFDDQINTNPNQPSQASNTQLIANAELSLSGLGSSPQGEFYPQYLSETQYVGASLYNTINFSFYSLYSGPLMNLESVLNSKTLSLNEGPVENQLAVAKILKAYYFWHITDRWGDVPFTEALKGKDNFTPAYDTQQSIYDNLFRLLDEANAEIVPGSITNDIIYGGDMDKWKKFANTIHMLMALRLSEVDATKASAEFSKALTAGIMTSNDDNFVFRHLAEAANQNYWYDQIANQGRYWWALSKPLVDYMKPLGDPRLPVYADKNEAGDYVGLEYGLETDLDKQDPSLLGVSMWKQDAPVYLVTYAEALFAKAEAAKRGWIAGGDAEAQANYNLAIEQSVRQWNNGDVSAVPAMIANPTVAYDPSRAIQQISEQRWVHLFMNGYEAWAEWRRTGFPVLTPPAGKEIPTRQAYPTEEQFNNKTHYTEAIQRQFGGTDDLAGKVWWDK